MDGDRADALRAATLQFSPSSRCKNGFQVRRKLIESLSRLSLREAFVSLGEKISSKIRETLLGWLIIGLAGVACAAAWATWPVSFWSVCIFTVYLFLHLGARRRFRARIAQVTDETGAPRLQVAPPGLFELVLRNLSNAVFYLGVGALAVAAAQLCLYLGAQVVDQSLVLSSEEWLSWTYRKLMDVLSFQVLVIAMGVFLLVALIFPRSDAVQRLIQTRDYLTRAALILLGVTSFTFFTGADLEHYDPGWRRAEQYRARFKLEEILREQRKIASAMWLDGELRSLNKGQKEEYTSFFNKSSGSPYSSFVVRHVAANLAKQAPTIGQAVQPASVPGEHEALFKQAQALLDAPSEQVTLKQLREMDGALANRLSRLAALREAAIELAVNGLMELSVQSERALVRTFVEEVSATVARSALEKAIPPVGNELEVTRRWVGETLKPGNLASAEAVPHRWNLNLRAAGAPIGASADVAMAAILTQMRLQTALHGINPRVGSGFKSSGFRFRLRP
jgi:hypothetical protein